MAKKSNAPGGEPGAAVEETVEQPTDKISHGDEKGKDAQRFLSMLFGDVENGWICLWRRDNKQTVRFPVSKIDEAAETAVKLGQEVDVYVGCGIQPSDGPPGERGKAATVCCIPGAWADIDVGDHGNGKKYIPTIDDALKYLKTLPVQPTIIVATGGGVHAWWLFHEPFEIKTEEDRVYATQVVGRWQALIRSHIGEYDLDSTHDLARVLRIPGTRNFKEEKQRPVTILQDDGPRTNPSDLLELAPDAPSDPAKIENPSDPAGLKFSLETPPDPAILEKIAIAIENDDGRLKKAWDREKNPSDDDQALANVLYARGWGEPEIVDALRWRRATRQCPKERTDYYARTLATCAESEGLVRARNLSLAAIAVKEIAPGAALGEPEKESTLDRIAEILGLVTVGGRAFIERVTTHDDAGNVEREVYRFTARVRGESRTVEMTGGVLISKGSAAKVLTALGTTVPSKMKGPEWLDLCDLVISSAVDVESDAEASDQSIVDAAVRAATKCADHVESLSSAMNRQVPYRDPDGGLWIRLKDIQDQLYLDPDGKRLSRPAILRAMRALGCRPSTRPNGSEGPLRADGVEERRWRVSPQLDESSDARRRQCGLRSVPSGRLAGAGK